ncbi:MAG: hypothetical protein NTW14_01985 [bacterium]|nr:hypothetical protein [bacterium]
MVQRITLTLCTLIFLILMIGCNDSGTSPSPPNTITYYQETMYPATGGFLEWGVVSVTIPPNALQDTTIISVGSAENPADYNPLVNHARVGAIYQLDPDGTTFMLPVTVRIGYSSEALGSFAAATLQIMTYSAADPDPVPLSNPVVDSVNHYVTGETDHFSYVFLAGATVVGSGNATYPPASGGNPQGNWNVDHVDYLPQQPWQDSLEVVVSCTVAGAYVISSPDWESNLLTTTIVRTILHLPGSNIVILDDSTYTVHHYWGSYAVSGSQFNSVITASSTNPENVGNIETQYYTASGDSLIFYRTEEIEGFVFDVYSVFIREGANP